MVRKLNKQQRQKIANQKLARKQRKKEARQAQKEKERVEKGLPPKKEKKQQEAPGGFEEITKPVPSIAKPKSEQKAPKMDLYRFVRWPKYVRLQRKKRIILQRMRTPPVVNQFTHTLDKPTTAQLFSILKDHLPESKAERRKRMRSMATKEEVTPVPKPLQAVSGSKKVTTLVEQKKARLVVIAHDVDPIDLIFWLPTLCVKKGVPYCIVKSKSRLGQAVRQKNTTCLAITDVKDEYKPKLGNIINTCKAGFNDQYAKRMKQWGEIQMGPKYVHKMEKREREARLEEERRAAAMLE